jgi:hypothetical protein
MRSAPTLNSWMTPFSSVAMLEKLALLKMASWRAPVLIRASLRRTSVTTSAATMFPSMRAGCAMRLRSRHQHAAGGEATGPTPEGTCEKSDMIGRINQGVGMSSQDECGSIAIPLQWPLSVAVRRAYAVVVRARGGQQRDLTFELRDLAFDRCNRGREPGTPSIWNGIS